MAEADRIFDEGVEAERNKQFELARDLFRQVISLDPHRAGAHAHLGNAFSELEKNDDATRHWTRAIELDPRHPMAYVGHAALAVLTSAVGRVREAVTQYRRAIELSRSTPMAAVYHANLLLALNYHPESSDASILAEARAFDAEYAAPLAATIRPHRNARAPERRIRLGYFAGDFGNVSVFLIPVLRHHDRDRFEIFCYSCTEKESSSAPVRARLDGRDHWRNVEDLPDEQAVELMRKDGIDILVNLTAANRMLVLARKPAPIQVFWIAYPGTTGLSTIDYRLSDPYLDPPGTDLSVYSEKTIRLPDSFWIYDPLVGIVPVGALPARISGCVTFGCLNAPIKLTDEAIALWSSVLRALPSSRMLLFANAGQTRARALAAFARNGIERSRIDFVDKQPRPDYFATYRRIDICLDPTPVPGHTTSIDSFWMGVPVVTIVGPTILGRGGVSIAMNLGLPELVARTPDQYVSIAVGLANDLDRLAELRAGLRARLEKSPLMDAPRFTRNLEASYRSMWREWCATGGNAP